MPYFKNGVVGRTKHQQAAATNRHVVVARSWQCGGGDGGVIKSSQEMQFKEMFSLVLPAAGVLQLSPSPPPLLLTPPPPLPPPLEGWGHSRASFAPGSSPAAQIKKKDDR